MASPFLGMGTTLRQSGWAPLLVFGTHVLCSRVLNAYARIPNLDVPMHLAGGMAIAFFVHTASRNGSRFRTLGSYHPLTHAGLVLGLTCTAAMFWEFAEYLTDRFLGTHAQGDDLEDTLSDMLLGLLGALTFLIVLFSFSKAARLPERNDDQEGAERNDERRPRAGT